MITTEQTAQQLRVSENGRHLVDADGKPFFLLADTAWLLLHDTNREEADLYLRDRAAKGFTMVQTLLMMEGEDRNGLSTPNRFGQMLLCDRDPARPNPAYFEHVDYVLAKAESLGLGVLLAPAWARGHIGVKGGPSRLFDPGNAHAYGEFLGRRYRDRRVIWVLGGDTDTAGNEPVWRAMARGLNNGAGARHLVTVHRGGGDGERGSSPAFHNEDWLDLNMTYSGHAYQRPTHPQISRDYGLTPPKPTFDGEAAYENIPALPDGRPWWLIVRNPDCWDRVTRVPAHCVRAGAYSAMLAGAAGHVYGCHDVWQFLDAGKKPNNFANTPWREALDFPGARQMGLMRRLFESRPWHTLAPKPPALTARLDGDTYHVATARAADGSFLLAYSPAGSPLAVDMSGITGTTVLAHWFDPRAGVWSPIGQFANTGLRSFTPPTSGRGMDWVLVLDDAERGYPTS
ncbi:MAG: glycoside hydrolase family 140 protein [Kiritimatiellae bacterium]|nr:glycoside hydrolase family 140 protein [Kiritimatiellia bacterium]